MGQSAWLNKLINDAHIPIAIGIFIVTTTYHFVSGKDLGSNYVSSLYGIYAFLGAHAAAYQKWPDKSNDGQGVGEGS